jgi:hypothetical protein
VKISHPNLPSNLEKRLQVKLRYNAPVYNNFPDIKLFFLDPSPTGEFSNESLFVVTLRFPVDNVPMEGVKLRKLKPGKKPHVP